MLHGAMWCLETEEVVPMRKLGSPTKYPGVYRVNESCFRVRAKIIDPRTGLAKEVDRLLKGVSARTASAERCALIEEASVKPLDAERVRVGEFARSWMKSKKLKVDAATAKTYADALDRHILPTFGNLYYDAVTPMDVQKWIDGAIINGWKTPKTKEERAYSAHTVKIWFRTFRTMTRDAVYLLQLQRDPTLRISFPELPEREEANALMPEQLREFLKQMELNYPQHYPLVVLLAYTGLRFCHACALRWEDWDEDAGVLRIRRKHARGEVGPVSRKKRAPKEYPVEPELKAVLEAHRKTLQEDEGWMFPASNGALRTPNSMDRAWTKCLDLAKIEKRFTVHGLRYTFTDLVRRANVDVVVRRALTGHVTEQMQRKYSTVGLDEKRDAIAGVFRLVRLPGGDEVGTEPETATTGRRKAA